jgi:hypothetical protein
MFLFPVANCIKFGDWCKIFGLFRKWITLLVVNIGTRSESSYLINLSLLTICPHNISISEMKRTDTFHVTGVLYCK